MLLCCLQWGTDICIYYTSAEVVNCDITFWVPSVLNQQTRELISSRKMSQNHNNKDLSCLLLLFFFFFFCITLHCGNPCSLGNIPQLVVCIQNWIKPRDVTGWWSLITQDIPQPGPKVMVDPKACWGACSWGVGWDHVPQVCCWWEETVLVDFSFGMGDEKLFF